MEGSRMIERRTEAFNVMLQPSERENLQRIADEVGLSMGAILRYAFRKFANEYDQRRAAGENPVPVDAQLWLP
jgi:hypothetical protein